VFERPCVRGSLVNSAPPPTTRHIENGYAVVARRGKLVVRVEVGRSRDPFSDAWTYPPLVKKRKAIRIARMALQAAT